MDIQTSSIFKINNLDDVQHVGARLGKGSFAQVKLVRHKASQKMLALKVIDLTASKIFDEEYTQIMRECKVHKSLNHPNIIK